MQKSEHSNSGWKIDIITNDVQFMTVAKGELTTQMKLHFQFCLCISLQSKNDYFSVFAIKSTPRGSRVDIKQQ